MADLSDISKVIDDDESGRKLAQYLMKKHGVNYVDRLFGENRRISVRVDLMPTTNKEGANNNSKTSNKGNVAENSNGTRAKEVAGATTKSEMPPPTAYYVPQKNRLSLRHHSLKPLSDISNNPIRSEDFNALEVGTPFSQFGPFLKNKTGCTSTPIIANNESNEKTNDQNCNDTSPKNTSAQTEVESEEGTIQNVSVICTPRARTDHNIISMLISEGEESVQNYRDEQADVQITSGNLSGLSETPIQNKSAQTISDAYPSTVPRTFAQTIISNNTIQCEEEKQVESVEHCSKNPSEAKVSSAQSSKRRLASRSKRDRKHSKIPTSATRDRSLPRRKTSTDHSSDQDSTAETLSTRKQHERLRLKRKKRGKLRNSSNEEETHSTRELTPVHESLETLALRRTSTPLIQSSVVNKKKSNVYEHNSIHEASPTKIAERELTPPILSQVFPRQRTPSPITSTSSQFSQSPEGPTSLASRNVEAFEKSKFELTKNSKIEKSKNSKTEKTKNSKIEKKKNSKIEKTNPSINHKKQSTQNSTEESTLITKRNSKRQQVSADETNCPYRRSQRERKPTRLEPYAIEIYTRAYFPEQFKKKTNESKIKLNAKTHNKQLEKVPTQTVKQQKLKDKEKLVHVDDIPVNATDTNDILPANNPSEEDLVSWLQTTSASAVTNSLYDTNVHQSDRHFLSRELLQFQSYGDIEFRFYDQHSESSQMLGYIIFKPKAIKKMVVLKHSSIKFICISGRFKFKIKSSKSDDTKEYYATIGDTVVIYVGDKYGIENLVSTENSQIMMIRENQLEN